MSCLKSDALLARLCSVISTGNCCNLQAATGTDSSGVAFSDVTFICRGNTKIPAHRFILAAQSPVFEVMLYPPFPEEQQLESKAGSKSVSSCNMTIDIECVLAKQSPIEVRLTDVDPEAFKTFLTLAYANKGKVNMFNGESQFSGSEIAEFRGTQWRTC